MCLWLSLQGTGPITCIGEPGRGPFSAEREGGCLGQGTLGLIGLQEELLRWEERQQILGPFTHVGGQGECEPIY